MLITTNDALIAYCDACKQSQVLFLDTEFMRERSYYAQLCLVQIAGETGEAAAIDTLADHMDLSPLYDLLQNPAITKVLHASRQDSEIFVQLTGAVPEPLYDTQIAAMVLGLGEQIGYNGLVQHFLKHDISKAQQYTDWAKRPLTNAQIAYALDDVRHLRDVYPLLTARLAELGREAFVADAMAPLQDPSQYQTDPNDAWQRIKKRDTRPHILARLQQLAAWRERYAQLKNRPRGMVLRDDTLTQLALTNPSTPEAIAAVRGVPNHVAIREGIAEALQHAAQMDRAQYPVIARRPTLSPQQDIIRDALKLLLKAKSAEYSMPPKLLADHEELTALACGEREGLACMEGERLTMFGQPACALLDGDIAFRIEERCLVFE